MIEAAQKANQEAGGSLLELGEAEYMVRASGYLRSIDDFRKIPLGGTNAGISVRLADVAHIQVGPEMRRGIAELNGEGEVAGGVVIMRSGKNALQTIKDVKAKLEKLKGGLPSGVEIVPVYDRSKLINRAVANLQTKLIEEFIVVALVCAVFLFHLRSALVAIVTLPIGILIAGIKSPVGAKVAGASLKEIDRITAEIERSVKKVPGVSSALAERLNGGRYVDIDIDRDAAARYGLNVADVQSVVSAAIGGDNIGETVKGLQRFPISVRYPREMRDSVEKLRQLPMLTERGAQISLGDVAAVRISDGPPMLKSENARLSGWVYVDIRDRALSAVVRDMQQAVAREVKLAPGYSISWSGQFEFMERATAKLKIVVPATLLIIFVLLYMTFKRFDEALLIMACPWPAALVSLHWPACRRSLL